MKQTLSLCNWCYLCSILDLRHKKIGNFSFPIITSVAFYVLHLPPCEWLLSFDTLTAPAVNIINLQYAIR